MRCNFDVDFILRYNDNGLSEIERRNFEEHRKGCILCKNKLVVDGDFIDYLKGSMIEDTSIQTYVMSEIDLNMYRGGKKMKLIHLLSWKSNGMKAAVAVLILGMLCLPFFLSQSLRAVVQNSVSNVLNKQNRMDNKNFLGTPTPAVSNTVAPSPMVTAKTSQTPMPEATPVTFKYPASEIKYVAPDGYQLHHVVDVDDQTLWLAMESDANYRMLSFNKVSKQVTEMTAFDKFLSQFGKTLPKMKILKNNDVYFSLGKKALIMDGKSFTLKKEIQFPSDVAKEEESGDGQPDISFAGDKLAYTTSEGLYICNLDFSNAQKVVNRFKGKTEMDVTVPRTPIWSFDDTKIGYTELGYEWTNGLCIFDVASNKTQKYSTKDTEGCFGLKWSKDSKTFAGAEDMNGGILVAEAPGSNNKAVTKCSLSKGIESGGNVENGDLGREFDYSPEIKGLLFAKMQEDYSKELILYLGDTKKSYTLADASYVSSYKFINGGKTIAFQYESGLYVLDTAKIK